MREGRWTTVTESEFDHERRGLDAIREKLPDTGPWRAWSNFTFTANSGHVREVDLVVVAPGGVHMVELKDWRGHVTSENGTWVQTTPGGRRVAHTNALHLVTKKSRELAGLLRQNGAGVHVSASVCFTNASLKVRLPPNDRHGIHTVDELVEMLHRPPANDHRRITEVEARSVKKALDQVGIRRSDSQYKVGPYMLDRAALDTGPTWADYQARHTELTETVRVRIYLSERGANDATASVEAAARREADVLRRFRHPGVVQLKQYDPSGHSAGPALIFDHHPATLRLDHYLARYGDTLDILDRVSLLRQLAETVRSAHSHHIHHRALAARSVHVIPRSRGHQGDTAGEEAAWRAPHLQVSDWQIALRRTEGTTRGATRLAPTTLSAVHLSDDADPYLAPELTALRPDPVALDVYGLGVLTYLLVTGRAPAASQAELLARLNAGEGLRPSALVDDLAEDIDDLVQAATAYQPERRLATVDEFLEMLEFVEETLTAPTETGAVSGQEPAPEKDPLEAVAGDVLDGRWEVRRRLGTGSTSRAFLVRDLHADPKADPKAPGVPPLAVLKVALSDSRAELLVREAEVLRGLRATQYVIQLAAPEPLTIGGRTVLALEYVGDERDDTTPGESGSSHRHRHETVARQVRESGRLRADQLEAYGDYLFGAVDSLEGEGVWHRDLKPDNIAIRVRPNRTRQLVLIDFSLAGFPARDTKAGTEGYLDPFLGTMTRSVYDAHAERYALAVTLHEMASGELPSWGDGTVAPAQTDPEEWAHPTIAEEAFDTAVRPGLTAFFAKALHRDTARRFNDLKPMRDAWRRIFLEMAQTTPSGGRVTRHPAPDPAAEEEQATPGVAEAEPLSAEQQRDRVAAAADRDTHLSVAGLTPAAESFLYGLDITTVGGLLDYSQRNLVNAPGLGAKTRKEIQRRQREWGERLHQAPASPLTPTGRSDGKAELHEVSSAEKAFADSIATGDDANALSGSVLRSVSLDALATLLVPEPRKNGSNHNEREVVRLLLRLPDEQGELPDIGVWPKQKDVAAALRLSAGRIPQVVKTQRTRWRKQRAMRELRTEILELLGQFGRVASAAEIADALAVRRGTRLHGRHQRRALALAAVRAVVEIEQLTPAESAFRHTANREATDEAMGAGLLALEVGENDAPDTPSAPGLLDYAQRLGRVADRLAELDTLPTASTVLGELGAVTPPPGAFEWHERRMVELAAAASQNAAVTPRLEIYPRNLSLVRALRLTQAGLARHIHNVPPGLQPGLPPDEVHERVRARFPELTDGRGATALPTGAPLTAALRQAGFDVTLSTREDTGTPRYLPANEDPNSSSLSGQGRRHSTHTSAPTWYDDDPQLASAVRADDRLLASAGRDGFRVVTVRTGVSEQAVAELTGPERTFGAEPVSVTALFLEAMRDEVRPGTKPTWDTLLRADAAAPGTNPAKKLAVHTRTAWGRVEPRVRARLDPAAGTGPVLLTDTAVFARYDAMRVLDRLADTARRGGRGLWLLCPQSDPTRGPRLGTVAVPYQEGLGEWVALVEEWVAYSRRVGAQR